MAGTEILGQAVESAKGDLLTIEGEVFRQIQDPNDPKRKILVPVKVEAHVNPVSILGGLAAALLGTLAGTIAWHGVTFPNLSPLGGPPIVLFKGLKDTGLGKDLNDAYLRFASRRGGQAILDRLVDEGKLDPDLASQDPCVLSQALWRAEGNAALRDAYKERARRDGCAWAQ